MDGGEDGVERSRYWVIYGLDVRGRQLTGYIPRV